jgi:protein O-GlcNAcase/histone acetyltransferase
LFANDYDMRRLYCGPFSGRQRELRGAVAGILINPNNEYPINVIPLRTFAAYIDGAGAWNPREEFLKAAAEWLPYFETVAGTLPLDDLLLLADCFYLPHREGPEAEKLLTLIHRLLDEPADLWGHAYQQFCALNVRLQQLFDRLSELRDRELFDAWSRHIWHLKEELQVIEAVLKQKIAGHDIVDGVALGQCLPGTFRGGTLAKLERMSRMDADGRIRVESLSSRRKET